MRELCGSQSAFEPAKRGTHQASLFSSSLTFNADMVGPSPKSARVTLNDFVKDMIFDGLVNDLVTPAPPKKSDDISKFIGNVYLDCIIDDSSEHSAPLILLSLEKIIDEIREQDFFVTNSVRMFSVKIGLLKEVLFQFSKLWLKHIESQNMAFELISAKITMWTRNITGRIEGIGAENPLVNNYKKFKLKFKMECETVKKHSETIKSECQHIMRECHPGNSSTFYATINEVMESHYNQYGGALSQIFHILQHSVSPAELIYSEKTSTSKLNLFMCEFMLCDAMRYYDQAVREDFAGLRTLLEGYIKMLQNINEYSQIMLADVKKLINDYPKLDSEEIIHGFKLFFDLQQVELSTLIDTSNELPKSLTQVIKNKIKTPMDHDNVIYQFFRDYSPLYTKHTHLIRHRMECSTVATKRKCILMLDVVSTNASCSIT